MPGTWHIGMWFICTDSILCCSGMVARAALKEPHSRICPYAERQPKYSTKQRFLLSTNYYEGLWLANLCVLQSIQLNNASSSGTFNTYSFVGTLHCQITNVAVHLFTQVKKKPIATTKRQIFSSTSLNARTRERARALLLTDSASYVTNELFGHLHCPDKLKSTRPVN